MIPENIKPFLDKTISEFQLNTKLRLAHFLAQVAHESGNFTHLSENLNYSAKGLQTTFLKYFPDMATALTYEHKPEAIASRVYANRMGNGDEGTREGWKYRGKGYIQLTGKENYEAFEKYSGLQVVENPDLLLIPENAMRSAGWFWCKVKNLNPIADKGTDDKIVEMITKRINGGLNGIVERKQLFADFYKELTI